MGFRRLRAFFGSIKIVVIFLLCVAIPGAAFVFGIIGWWVYNGQQGTRDSEVVRFARMLGLNDRDVVDMAKLLETNRDAAINDPRFEQTAGRVFDFEEMHNAFLILHYAYDIQLDHPRLERRLDMFDWKDGWTNVTDTFDDMLDGVGLATPTETERDAFLEETEKLGEKYTAIPILIARYDPYFRRGGYQLTHINTGSDSYAFTLLPMKTARCWDGAGFITLPDSKETDLFVEPAIMQAVEFINDHMPELKPLVAKGQMIRPFPKSACLPFRLVVKDMFFPPAPIAPKTEPDSTATGAIAIVEDDPQDDIADLIARADRWLKQNRPIFYAALQPGVSDADLDAYEARHGLKLPAALRALWKWKNGIPEYPDLPDGESEALVDNHAFISLQSSSQTKDILDGMIGTDFESPDWWKREWVPFTHNGGGDNYVVDTADPRGRVIDFWHADADRPVAAPSFPAWFKDLVDRMERGELEVD
jgi:cell wall assembly regulator SMI1